jgi:hypothetical protein
MLETGCYEWLQASPWLQQHGCYASLVMSDIALCLGCLETMGYCDIITCIGAALCLQILLLGSLVDNRVHRCAEMLVLTAGEF